MNERAFPSGCGPWGLLTETMFRLFGSCAGVTAEWNRGGCSRSGAMPGC